MLLFFSHLISVFLVCHFDVSLQFGLIFSYFVHMYIRLISSHQVSFLLNDLFSCFDTFLLLSSFFFLISISPCLISHWCIMFDPFSHFVLTSMLLFRSHLYYFVSSQLTHYLVSSHLFFSSHLVLYLFPWSCLIRSHLFSTLFWHYSSHPVFFSVLSLVLIFSYHTLMFLFSFCVNVSFYSLFISS